MNENEIILLLSVAVVAMTIMAAIFFATAEARLEDGARLSMELKRAKEEARAQKYKADMYNAALMQTTNRVRHLEQYSKSLHDSNAILAQRNQWLTGLLKNTEAQLLTGLAVMPGPSKLHPSDTINLN